MMISNLKIIFSLYNLYTNISTFQPFNRQIIQFEFYPLEVVSRRRDPQLQVSEKNSDLTKWWSSLFKSCWLMSHFMFNIFKLWYLMC